jgi:hypothetical protein
VKIHDSGPARPQYGGPDPKFAVFVKNEDLTPASKNCQDMTKYVRCQQTRYPILYLMSEGRERIFGRIKAPAYGERWRCRYPLSFADCFLVTPTRKMDSVIMTGDPEFNNVEHIIEIEWLAK